MKNKKINIMKKWLMYALMVGVLTGCNSQNQDRAETESLLVTEAMTESQMEVKTEAQTETKNETESESETEIMTETETQTETETEMQTEIEEGPIVVIDPGHQGPGFDMSGQEAIAPGSSETKLRIVSGTTGRTTGLAEYILNLDISLLLRDELINRGYQVVMTRETHDIDISNIERAQVATNAGADIVVRIHANGVDDTNVAGALTMAPSAANPYVGHMYEECNYLSRVIINRYCEATGLQNRGILEVDYMTGINWSTVPVTIVEMGFMTNPGDDTYMADPANHEAMVVGIANGIDEYFGR